MKALSLTLSFLVFLMPQALTPSEDARLYATISDVKGPAIVGEERLKKGAKIYADQTIECRLGSGVCVISLKRCELQDDQIKIDAGKRHRIPAVNCRIVREELEGFRTGGRKEEPERSSGDIISPNTLQASSARWLILRWQPFPSPASIILSIESPGGQVLWSESVSGAQGELISQKAREAVLGAQTKGNLNLTLSLRAPNRPRVEVAFALQPQSEETQLDRELAPWEAETGVLRFLGRAAVFSSHDLHAEAATELERALEYERLSSPDFVPVDWQRRDEGSRRRVVDLLTITIGAESYAQNTVRLKQLCATLSRLDKSRKHCSCSRTCRRQ